MTVEMKLIFCVTALLGLATGQDCRGQMESCQSEGFTDFSSDAISEWTNVIKTKGYMDFIGCFTGNRCLQNFDCFMKATWDFSNTLPECADDSKKKGGDMEKKIINEFMNMIADKKLLAAFSRAICHPDDADDFGSCISDAVGPAFVLYGPNFLHKKLRKDECVKKSSDECRTWYKGNVEKDCLCSSVVATKIDDFKAFTEKACGANTFADGVNIERIRDFMLAKKCESKKNQMCMGEGKKCMKETTPPTLALMDEMRESQKAEMALKMIGQAMPKAAECFAASAGKCVADPQCAMDAVNDYKQGVANCAAINIRSAFTPKDARDKMEMMRWLELVFGNDLGPTMMKSMCDSEDSANILRACLQASFPPPAAGFAQSVLAWKKESMPACAAKSSPDCSLRWNAMWSEKCNCATTLASDAANVKDYVVKSCGEATVPPKVADFESLFAAKKDFVCKMAGMQL